MKRIIALMLSILLILGICFPKKVKAIDPVTGTFLAVSLGHLALDAYRTWRAEHPNSNDSDYNGFNPGVIVSDENSKGGSFSASGSFAVRVPVKYLNPPITTM